MNYNIYRVDWCRQIVNYRRRLKTATDEVARLQKQLSERAQTVSVQGSDKLRSLRGTMEELSVALGKEKAQLQWLKI